MEISLAAPVSPLHHIPSQALSRPQGESKSPEKYSGCDQIARKRLGGLRCYVSLLLSKHSSLEDQLPSGYPLLNSTKKKKIFFFFFFFRKIACIERGMDELLYKHIYIIDIPCHRRYKSQRDVSNSMLRWET